MKQSSSTPPAAQVQSMVFPSRLRQSDYRRACDTDYDDDKSIKLPSDNKTIHKYSPKKDDDTKTKSPAMSRMLAVDADNYMLRKGANSTNSPTINAGNNSGQMTALPVTSATCNVTNVVLGTSLTERNQSLFSINNNANWQHGNNQNAYVGQVENCGNVDGVISEQLTTLNTCDGPASLAGDADQSLGTLVNLQQEVHSNDASERNARGKSGGSGRCLTNQGQILACHAGPLVPNNGKIWKIIG